MDVKPNLGSLNIKHTCNISVATVCLKHHVLPLNTSRTYRGKPVTLFQESLAFPEVLFLFDVSRLNNLRTNTLP